ncbi:MAG: hypothetical protein MUC50_18770, partial [Myxococcota bacterium]|nr:hypothetical protein [Myxococcota bacterium]
MIRQLSDTELVELVKRVFGVGSRDKRLAILVDLPDEVVSDNADWKARRQMALEWRNLLSSRTKELGLEGVSLVFYRNAH